MRLNKTQQIFNPPLGPAVIRAKFSSIRKPARAIHKKATSSREIDKHGDLRLLSQRTEGLTEPAWGLLINRIKAGMCTVFVGAGANDGILPLGSQIADDWATSFEFPFLTRELPKVAQFVAIESGERYFPHDQLIKRFKDQLAGVHLDTKIKHSPLALLAQLPVTCYMTTNYDGFMYRALELAGKQPTQRICKWYRDENESKEGGAQANIPRDITATIDRPVVFHLHGHESNLKSMVLTEDDYYDFLISWVRDQYMIPPFLQSALARTSLLFVGYRLADMSFRVLFRSVFRAMDIQNRFSNVAVQLPPEDASEAARRYLSKYFGEDKIHVFWGNALRFVEEFRPRLLRSGIVK